MMYHLPVLIVVAIHIQPLQQLHEMRKICEKVFISIPMANKSKEEIKEELDKRKSVLEQLSFEVADTYIENGPNVKNIALWCLGKSLEIMADCDIAYFCKGWQKAKGCLVEYEAAVQYGLQVITED